MKRIIFFIFILIFLVKLTGCYESDEANQKDFKASEILTEEMESYEIENSVNVIQRYQYDNHSAMMFEKENKVGVAQFFIDKDKLEFTGKDVQEIQCSDEKLFHFQFMNKTGCYIAIFIKDPIFQQSITDIYIRFEKNDEYELKEIQESTVNSKGLLIRYDGKKLREIDHVDLIQNGKVIYSKSMKH